MDEAVGNAPMPEPDTRDPAAVAPSATGASKGAFLVEEEGTASSFRGLVEVIEEHGLFMELYTDRGSHYFVTPQAGEPDRRISLLFCSNELITRLRH